MSKIGNVFIFLAVTMLFLGIGASQVEAQPPPGPEICQTMFNGNGVAAACMDLAFPHKSGNETIRVHATSNQNINASLFNIWFNGTLLNFTNGGLTFAMLNVDESTVIHYDPSNITAILPMNNTTSPPRYLDIVLNKTFILDRVEVNLTVNGTVAYFPDGFNSTMFTINYVAINTSVPNTLLMLFNNATKTFGPAQGPAMTDGNGYFLQHCIGIYNATTGGCNAQKSSLQPNTNFANLCNTHGAPFFFGGQGPSINCQLNTTYSIYAYDFISSNASTLVNITPGTPLQMSVNVPVAASFLKAFVLKSNPQGGDGPFQDVNISNADVYKYGTSEKIFSMSGIQVGTVEPPIFVERGRFYNLSINVSGFNLANYPVMLPFAGFTGLMIVLPNTSDNTLAYTTVYGKVVNETGAVVPGAIVYAQFHKGSVGNGLMLFNSSITDNNGVFSMTIPQTKWMQCGGGAPSNCMWPWPVYQFVIISNQTNPTTGAPLYFQSIDNNNGYGYFAQSNNLYISKSLVLRSGGQATVNVTLNGAGFIISELAKLLGLGIGTIKEADTGKLTMLNFFNNVQLPSTINLSYFSPTGNVLLNFFGYNNTNPAEGQWGSANSITKVCFNSTTVSQGQTAGSSCNMTQPGYLKLRACSKTNLFTDVVCDYTRNRPGDFGFWFETSGIIRDAGTGNIVLYLSPEGIVLPFMVGFGSSNENLTLPLPQGNYTIELLPSFEWSRHLGVYNITNFSIISGQNTTHTIVFPESWQINPMFNPSMILSENNRIEANVFYGQSGELNNSFVTMSAIILYPNKTALSTPSPLIYNSTTHRFENTTFNPSSLGAQGGKYLLLLNATNITSGNRFTSIFIMPIHAYDFQVGIDLGGFTFGTGQTVYGRIFAYNSTGPIPSNTSPIIVDMFDMSGTPINIGGKYNVSPISNGMGAINITMPTTTGFYNIIVKVNASDKIGVSDNWMQITNLNIQTTTDKFNYAPTDTVYVTIKVSNATNNQPLNASAEVNLDGSNTPAINVSDASGKITIALSPAIYGNNGTWSFGWKGMRIKVSVYTPDNNIYTADTYSGFDVRGLELHIISGKPSYSQSDNVTLEVFGPPGFSVSNVEVDGNSLSENMGCNNPQARQQYCIDNINQNHRRINLLSGWSPGKHNIKIEANTNEGEQTFYSGFDISLYNIIATTDKFNYDLNENIFLNITVTYPNNGSAVSGIPVNVTLYKANPPNDIYVANNSSTTNANGKVLGLRFNATQPGFNLIKINVSNQLWSIGVSVSSLKVELQDDSGNVVTQYTASAGSSVTIRVNASSAPDGSLVKAVVWAFGRPQELPSNTTTGGKANITFTIPPEAPAQDYGLEVRVITSAGDVGMAPPAMLRVIGGSALELEVSTDRSFMQPYLPGEPATYIARLKYTNGTAVSGRLIEFTYDSKGIAPTKIGNATTDSSGVATLKAAAPTSDGPYHLMAVVKGTDIEAHNGFLVSSLDVGVTFDKPEYNPGDTMAINITLRNRTSGQSVAATMGFIAIFNKEKGKMDIPVNTTGNQPYIVNIPIPNEPDVIGTYPMAIVMFSDRSQGVGFAMVDVVNASMQVNVSVPASIVAGTAFNVTITATTGTRADVAIFSPTASTLIYDNDSVSLSGTPPGANITINLAYPGVYIVDVYVQDVGSKMRTITVLPPTTGTIPRLWTHTSVSTDHATNTTTFTTSQDVYIMSNIGNTTAIVMMKNATTNTTKTLSLPMNLVSGSTYYAIVNKTELVSGQPYFVRLDTNQASGIATIMFRVS